MRSINFIQFGAENFCNYISPIILDIRSGALTLITGPNGSGKSTIFDILPYTLYNRTSNDLVGSDCVNDKIGSNCHTWVTWFEGNDKYRADRYCEHKKFGNTVILTKNGENIKRGHKEFLEEIEKLILPQKLLMNVLYFSQKCKTFFTDLGDTDQKAIFRMILQLEEYVDYYKKADKKLKGLEIEFEKSKTKQEVTNNLIQETTNQIKNVISQKEEFNKRKKLDIEELKIKLKQENDTYSNLDKELKYLEKDNIENKITNLKIEIENWKNQLQKFEQEKINQIKDIEAKVQLKQSEFKNQATSQKSEIELESNNKIKDLSTQQEVVNKYKILKSNMNVSLENNKRNIQRTDLEISKLEKEIKSLIDTLNKDEVVCELCQQVVGQDKLIHIKDHLNKKDEEVKVLRDQKSNLSMDVKCLLHDIEDLDILIREHERDLKEKLNIIEEDAKNKIKEIGDKLKEAYGKLSNKLIECKETIEKTYTQNVYSVKQKGLELNNELVNYLTQYTEKKKKVENFNKIKLTIESIKTQLNSKESDKFDEEILESLTHRKVELTKELEELKKSIIEQSELITMVEFWKIGFSPSGIPNILIDESIPFMNSKVSEYLEKISGGRYIVSFDTMRETKSGEFRDKISVNVLDTQTKANMRKKLSGGQTRVVDIATILTLSDLQCLVQDVKFNIMLFDEIFDALDDENIGYVSKILRYLAKDKSIFLISHRHIDSIEADEVLSFFNKK